jgi:hypothetical protein
LSLPQEPDTESEYAAEGTAAHELAEACLLTGIDAEDYIGQTFYGYVVDQGMADNVQVYLDECNRLVSEIEGEYEIEAYLSHSKIADFGGTADFKLVSDDTVYLVDLKYGSGHVVEVAENSQLLCYGTLAFDRSYSSESTPDLNRVVMTIVQPRATHEDGPVRSTSVTAEEVWAFEDQIQNQVYDNGDHIEAGEHCRWCPAKVHCPELKRKTQEAAKAEFEPEGMTLGQAAELIKLRQPMRAYLDEVYKWLHGRMEKGEIAPGMKLVESYGNRQWTLSEDELVAAIKEGRRIAKDTLYDSKLKSPAKMEKLIGKEAVEHLTERPKKGSTVVPDYDKRPAIETQTAKEEFGEAN